MRNKFEARRGAFKANSSAQRQYFLERLNAEKEDASQAQKLTVCSTVRDEFLNRVVFMQGNQKPDGVQPHGMEMNPQKGKVMVPFGIHQPKGFSRQADADGNLILQKNGEISARISNYVPKLVRIMVDEDGNRFLRISVIPAQSLPASQRRPFFVDIEEGENIADRIQKERKSLALECNFGRARSNLDAFVMDQAAYIPEELVYTQPGIVKTEYGYDFLDRKGSLRGFDVSVNMKQELGYNFNWPEKYVADMIVNLLKISDDLEKILPVVLFSVLARISELFEMAGCRPKAYLQMCGRTGSLKTSVATTVLAPYRNADGDIPPGTFEHTAAALEIEACRHRGGIFLVDDIHPVHTQADRQRIYKSHGSLVRMYGDGSSNVRANGSMKKQKTYKAAGLCAFTAEYPLGAESDRARGLIVEVNQRTYKGEILGFYQQNPTLVPTFLAYFLRYILPNAEDIVNYIAKKFNDERVSYLGMFEHGRQTDCYACLKIMADLILQYLNANGVIEDINKTDAKWTKAIFKAVKDGQAEIKEKNPTVIFVKTFHMMVTMNRMPLIPFNARLENAEKMMVGFFDATYYYLQFETVYMLVASEAEKQGNPINLNKKQLILSLANEGFLETFNETRNGVKHEVHTKKISVSKDERVQMVLMKRSILNEKMEAMVNG